MGESLVRQVAQLISKIGPGKNLIALAGVCLCASGQVVAGWTEVSGFALSASGAMLLVVWGWPANRARRQGVVATVGITLAALTPISASWLGPAMLTGSGLKGSGGSVAQLRRPVLAGITFGVGSAVALTLWWFNRSEIVFYELMPMELISGTPVVVVVGGCIVAAALNSIWEETLWRQMLIRPFMSARPAVRIGAVVALAGAFGLAHLHSAPGGWGGVVLTAMFALVAHAVCLLLRRGLIAAIIGHFLADLTLLLLIAFGG